MNVYEEMVDAIKWALDRGVKNPTTFSLNPGGFQMLLELGRDNHLLGPYFEKYKCQLLAEGPEVLNRADIRMFGLGLAFAPTQGLPFVVF